MFCFDRFTLEPWVPSVVLLLKFSISFVLDEAVCFGAVGVRVMVLGGADFGSVRVAAMGSIGVVAVGDVAAR